jgi:hypothetical protein
MMVGSAAGRAAAAAASSVASRARSCRAAQPPLGCASNAAAARGFAASAAGGDSTSGDGSSPSANDGDGGGTRARALSLYRQLLRGAEKMPTPNRRRHVARKTRSEFRANKGLTDPEEIQFCLRLADTNLDTVLLQAEHLTRLMRDPSYHADI